MKTIRLVFACSVLIAAGRVLAEDKAAPALDDKMAPLERFAGEWVINGKWASGEELHARTVYDWGLGKKILTAKTFVMNGDKEYQRYEGVMTWHPEKKSLYEISFSFDGSISEYLIDNKDKDTLQIGYTPIKEGTTPKVRQTIQFKDKDSFVWTVQLKDGDNWQTIMEGTWKRKAK
jgi:hypothetical protein